MMNRRIINALLLISFLIVITAITPDTDPLDTPQDLSDYECCVDINVAVDIVKDDVCIVEATGYLTGGTVLSDDEYGDEETYSNSEFSVGFEFNKPDKDWTIDGGPGMKNEKQFYEGTTPGTGLSLSNPSAYDGLVIK